MPALENAPGKILGIENHLSLPFDLQAGGAQAREGEQPPEDTPQRGAPVSLVRSTDLVSTLRHSRVIPSGGSREV